VDIVLTQRNFAIFSAAAARQRLIAPFELRDNSQRNLKAIARFGVQLRAESYTHALVATEDPGGYRLAATVAAPVRIGFANGWGKPLKTLWIRSLLTRTIYRSAGLDPRAPHECDVLFELGNGLVDGASPTRDASRLRKLVLDGVPQADSRIAFQVTDQWARLGIGFEQVVALARERSDWRAIASAHESAYADAFSAAAQLEVERFEDLNPWKGAIAGARALVAPDSGALHVASMVGTPTVAIFPANRSAALQSARWAPWAAPYRIVIASPDWPARAIAALNELTATA
jgi:ADP-heptose:LPS heptosyltransferase